MIIVFLISLLVLVVYSYSQIDLNLTLFQNQSFLRFQQEMIQLGYFNRPLSTLIYILILGGLFLGYIYFLRQAQNKRLRFIQLAWMVGIICIVSLLAYPAFSHDFFNYLFDARIVTHYGLNPYLYKPLDFSSDTWLRFMNWTHRTYPYGPIWIALTVPLSFLGLGKFIFTAVLFKILFLGAYLGNIYLIKKIFEKTNPSQITLGIVFYALNPLVIIESLLSPHLDSIMATLLLLSLYFLVTNRKVLSLISLAASGGIKFLTWILLPLFVWKKLSFKKLTVFSCLILLITLVPVIIEREAYPWYFLPIISLLALLTEEKLVVKTVFIISYGLLLTYVPYLFVGSYPPEVQNSKLVILVVSLIVALSLNLPKKLFRFNNS